LFRPVGSLIYHNILCVKLFYNNEAGTDTGNWFEGEMIVDYTHAGHIEERHVLLQWADQLPPEHIHVLQGRWTDGREKMKTSSLLDSDNVKLLNPPVENKTLTLAQVFEGTARPLYWQKAMCDLDPWYHNNNGFINEDLIVWMREAAFPNFKKLYEGCRLGTTATISPTWSPSGAERKWHCPVSWVGGQNNFLTVAYQITDCLILLLAVIFTAIWWKFGMNGQNMEE
ncbi:hypothetical protein J4Q44_G00146060, partial [Coregonus suidteri]